MASSRRPAPQIPVRATISLAWGGVGRRLGRWLVLTAIVQGAVVVVAAPLLTAAFQTVLASAGVASLTTATAMNLLTNPWSIALLVLFLVLAVVALIVQAGIFSIAADAQQSSADGDTPRPRVLLLAIARRMRALARPSTLLLLPFLLLLAPLGHAALGSVLTSWIAVPNFISGELQRTPVGTAVWIVLIALLWYLNLRLVLTIPFLAIGGKTVPQAFRASWAATRWRSWRVVAILLAIIVPAAVALFALGTAALGATAIADAINDDGSPIVAAIAFAVVQVTAFFVVGIAFVAQAQARVRIVRGANEAWTSPQESESPEPTGPRTVPGRGRQRASLAFRWAAAGTVIASVLAVAGLSVAALPSMGRVADGHTLLIAHRGVTTAAPENTIPALEAAAALGADVVEFDVQQTSDGDWVVMHDFDLLRLTGSPGAVKDMTLAEATAITIRENGFEAPMPSMREWVRRAAELEQPLLVEIKPHGQETDDYLERFYAILDEEGVTEQNIYHSLSADVVAGQTAMRPETLVGYIVPISFGGVPTTPADFLVVEEFSVSDEMIAAQHDAGKGIMVWTVDGELSMRNYLRAGVDGIITDQLALLQEQAAVVADETGLVPKLLDALDRAVKLW